MRKEEMLRHIDERYKAFRENRTPPGPVSPVNERVARERESEPPSCTPEENEQLRVAYEREQKRVAGLTDADRQAEAAELAARRGQLAAELEAEVARMKEAAFDGENAELVADE